MGETAMRFRIVTPRLQSGEKRCCPEVMIEVYADAAPPAARGDGRRRVPVAGVFC
jgi:hypothetical protein